MGMPIIKPSTITRKDSIGNIISSMAEEESAIAHILNAESEKLEKVINNSTSTVEDLMAINRSVKTAVNTAIQFEMALKAKLEMFQSTICQIS